MMASATDKQKDSLKEYMKKIKDIGIEIVIEGNKTSKIRKIKTNNRLIRNTNFIRNFKGV